MATTGVAIGKIELQRRKNLPIPNGWALDKACNVTTDASEAFEAGLLLPLGGLEITSGYKGMNASTCVSLHEINQQIYCLFIFPTKAMA